MLLLLLDISRILVTKGGYINCVDKQHSTPLHIVFHRYQVSVSVWDQYRYQYRYGYEYLSSIGIGIGMVVSVKH